jgi:Uma2 family endonuclease
MNAPLPVPDAVAPAYPPAAMPEEPVIPLTVQAYHALIDAGIYQSGDPFELLEGFVVRKMTKGPKHETARRKLRQALAELVSGPFFVDEQGAITTSDSEPEPDTFIVRGTIDDYSDRHAGPADVALLVEIADSSLHRDRGQKQRIYARAKVPVYWVVNVRDQLIEVHTEPSGPTSRPKYARQTDYRAPDEVPVVIDGQEIGKIPVATIVGKAG